MNVYQVSSLEKVFLDYQPPKTELEQISVLKNEQFSISWPTREKTFSPPTR